MALELGDYNIRVNSIAPGLFRAEMTENIFRKSNDLLKIMVEKTIPLKNIGTINPAMTSVVRYLIHDSSTYVSGNIFIVDSGYTLPAFPIFSSLWNYSVEMWVVPTKNSTRKWLTYHICNNLQWHAIKFRPFVGKWDGHIIFLVFHLYDWYELGLVIFWLFSYLIEYFSILYYY